MKGKEAEELLMKIQECFGFTKEDFEDGRPLHLQWGPPGAVIDVEDLGHRSLKIGKNIGDVYIDKISTDGWVVVGKGTKLHCKDLTVGEELVEDFEGFLM